MHSLKWSCLTVVASFGLMALSVPLHAQQPPPVPTPHTPDLLGVYPGMPMQAAEAQLQKHSSAVYVETNTLPVSFDLTISSPQSADITTVYVTQPPNDPPTVWMIQRNWGEPGGPGMTMASLLSALHAKYGQETMRKQHPDITLYWIFDRNGRLLSHADPALMNCSGGNFVVVVSNGNSPVGGEFPVCYKGFFAVTANFNASTVIKSYHVELVNLPYAARAATITANAKKAAADRARQQQIEKASRNKPTF